jgi:predicted HicB family RNase H-like nuclease
MKDIITYKEFIGSVHFNAEDEVFFGKIEGIDDLVTFEGNTVIDLKKAFEDAVDDYLELCSRNEKEIEKSYRGNFNIRISPELHKKVKRTAIKMGISLNQFIQKAVEDELKVINT